MAYEVTATRRRPKTFDEMAGQDFVVATLKSSIESGRIAHAYLFSGPRGCGKTSAARILARSLNCEKGPTAVPCGVCPACVEIARGSSLDVIEIDGASNTSVNDVRQIKDEVLFPPNSGRFKVYIIDEVHMLSNSAFNALLKTIEEPPPYIVFIFATTELHKVPATIKSRCQQFNFRLFSVDTIKGLLADACRETGIEAEDEALFWIAKEATGSMRDAYTLFDQVASFSDGKLSAELIREKLGLIGLDAVNELAEACAEGRTADALDAVDRLLLRGVAVEQFIVDLVEYYRSLLLLKSGIDREALLGYAPDRYSRKALDAFSAVQIERAVSLLLDLYRDIRFSVSPRFELETAVSRLCWLKSWVSPAELRAAIDGVRGRLLSPSPTARGGPPEPAGCDEPAADASSASSNIDKVPADFDPSKPGAFTETFKRFMAERDGKTNEKAPSRSSVGSMVPTPLAAQAPGAVPAAAAPASLPSSEVSPAAVPAPEAPRAFVARNLPPDDEDEETGEDADEAVPVAPLPPKAAESPAPPPPQHGAAAGPAKDAAAIKESVIATLKKDRGMLASGLEKSGPWAIEGSKVVIPVSDRLSAELLRKDSAVIGAAIREAAGCPCEPDIQERRPTAEGAEGDKKQSVPPQVETVRRLFRGTIVKTPAG